MLMMFTSHKSFSQEIIPTHLETRYGAVDIKNGYPTDNSVKVLYDELDFQRAVQAYIWATPLVSMEAVRMGNLRDYGADINQVLVNDSFTKPNFQMLTGNNTTIYSGITIDVRNGPMVVDSPQGVLGVIDDFWERPVADIGPFGPDKGKGGKFLIAAADYKGKIPAGYYLVRTPTNRVVYLGRASVVAGNIQSAIDKLKTTKVYALADAANPPATKVVLAGGRPSNTVAPQGFGYWEMLASAINAETAEPRDLFFYAMLKPLGIEKGRPFTPDARQKKILTDAAELGFRMAQTISMVPRSDKTRSYPNTQWDWVLSLHPNQDGGNYGQLDERTDYTFEAAMVAEGMIKKMIGAGSQYMSTAKDKTGAWLDGGKNYMLHVPPNAPVKDFWAVTVYDNLTRSMIQTDTEKAGVDSKQSTLQKNADGSVDVYFGPKAPEGKENNWIKTTAGKGWFTYFRWYGPTEAFFDKTWKLSDIEEIK